MCGKSFTSGSTLCCLQKVHTREKSYECSDCGKSLSMDQYSFDTAELTQEKGLMSAAMPTSNSALHCHQSVHIVEWTLTEVNVGNLLGIVPNWITPESSHWRKHYECTDCGRSSARFSYLSKHQRVHTGERPYECSECENPYFCLCPWLSLEWLLQWRMAL